MVLPGLFSPAATCGSSLTGGHPRVGGRQMRPFRVRGPPQRLVVPRVADTVALALGLLGTHERQDDEEEYADDGEAEPQECLEHAHEAERTGSRAVPCDAGDRRRMTTREVTTDSTDDFDTRCISEA